MAATEGAEFRGEVEDTESLYRTARVLVDATRSGGGTRLKVLNALARGVPVVASPLAAQGLDVVSGEHLLVANGDNEMVDAIELLLRDANSLARTERERPRAGPRAATLRRLPTVRWTRRSPASPLTPDDIRRDRRGTGCALSQSDARQKAARAIAELAGSPRPSYVVKPYSEFMPRAASRPAIREILNGAALCLPDGIGILWAAHYLSLSGSRLRALWQLPLSLASIAVNPRAIRRPLKQNMAGVDLTWEMLSELDSLGATVFLLGGTQARTPRNTGAD